MNDQFRKSASLMTEILGAKWLDEQLAAYASFREAWSPETRWHHRKPTVSAVVPIMYWSTRDAVATLEEPFGFWGGNPTEILNRLAEEIEFFRPYWSQLPNARGKENLRWALSTPRRFFSLSHELATAFQFASRAGVIVDPLFLDPQSSKGKPDLIVKTPSREFAVQCKSEDPTAATQMPYDLFQYFAGMYQRMVEDSGRSYHLFLHLSKNIDLGFVNKIVSHTSNLIGAGISLPSPWRTTYCDFELNELGVTPNPATIESLRRKARSQPGDPLYFEYVKIDDAVPMSGPRRRLSGLFISGKRGREVHQVIASAITNALREARTKLPLIVAVHVYQSIDFTEFKDRQVVQERFVPWTNQVFEEHPNLALIFISSNHELYTYRVVGDAVAVKYARHGWVLESPSWDHADMEELGI